MTTVLIIGASRGIGLEAVRQALAAGHMVRALARSASEIEIDHPQLEKISGSALDPEIVRKAVSGTDAVITALGVPPTLQHVHLFSGSARVVTTAMNEEGVRRLIAVTGIGAGDSKGIGGPLYARFFQPLFLGKIYEDKDLEEGLIRKSGLDWTIVRPGFLTRFAHTGRYKVLTDRKEWTGGFISRADVADFLVKQIDDDTYIGQTPLLIG